MPAKILSIPFIIAVLALLYLTWEVDSEFSVFIIPPVVILSAIYVLSPQINWWWYKRNPPEMDLRLRHLFQKHNRFYQGLSLEHKKLFRDRVGLFMIAREFMPQAMERVPEDLKGMVAANAIRLTFGLEDFLLSKFERVVIYPKPFHSPQYPRKFHASEIFEEDGVLLFSAEQLAKGTLHPDRFFNIGLYEFAKVFVICHPEHSYPKFGEDVWTSLERISGFSRESISKWINLDDIDPIAVSISHFFTFPNKFKEVLPEVFGLYIRIFRQDPLTGIDITH